MLTHTNLHRALWAATAVLTLTAALIGLWRPAVYDRIVSDGRRAGRREISAGDRNVKRARELKAQGLKPADIGKIIGASRATVYRYLSLDGD